MSTPAAKRRRIDAAVQALSKPFRSPFKTPFKSPVKDTVSVSSTDNENTQANAIKSDPNALTPRNPNAHFTTPHSEATKTSTNLNGKVKLPTTSTPLSRPGPKITGRKYTSPIATAQLNSDPDIIPLIKAQKELEKTLREVKEELDAAEQAWKIEESSRRWNAAHGRDMDDDLDGELVELCEKWNGASRLAAEELFGKVRERVNRMGGPRAWKEAQKKQQEFHNSWDDQANANQDNDEDDEEDENGASRGEIIERDVYAEYSIDPETEIEKEQRRGTVNDIGERPGEEDEFTMAMMLRTLNVELEVIGYDKDGQRWSD